jgi:flagellar motor switch protein FliN/FliY
VLLWRPIPAAEGVAVEQEAPSSAEAIARSVSGKDVNIDTLLKVPVSLSIEVGRTQMVLSDLLETQEGTVIELERLLEEPLDILVNGALIAHGVVVLANERFGLQITDIISLEERARSL